MNFLESRPSFFSLLCFQFCCNVSPVKFQSLQFQFHHEDLLVHLKLLSDAQQKQQFHKKFENLLWHLHQEFVIQLSLEFLEHLRLLRENQEPGEGEIFLAVFKNIFTKFFNNSSSFKIILAI